MARISVIIELPRCSATPAAQPMAFLSRIGRVRASNALSDAENHLVVYNKVMGSGGGDGMGGEGSGADALVEATRTYRVVAG